MARRRGPGHAAFDGRSARACVRWRDGHPGVPELDVVVHGATGFAGRLVAGYLARHAPDGVSVGLSGRSQERLRQVRDGLGERAAGWPLLTADAHDDDALHGLARRARVVASTVGPYQRFGLPLTRACAAEGTDYVDLTGEVLFMRASIDANHGTAQRTGARLVHACGFDSDPVGPGGAAAGAGRRRARARRAHRPGWW